MKKDSRNNKKQFYSYIFTLLELKNEKIILEMNIKKKINKIAELLVIRKSVGNYNKIEN